jgi:osmotically-inducible protein OsmY
MKTNQELQNDVQDAIKWEPLFKAAQIGVTAEDGIVTLTGVVDSYAKKLEAERAAKNVAGVKAVVEKIEIKFGNWGVIDDNDIAKEVLNAFKWSWEIPNDTLKVKVENGLVTLEGVLSWNYQKEDAKKMVSKLAGVKGVSNCITLKTEEHDKIEKAEIERAFDRNWALDSRDITVSVTDNHVKLTGTVDSSYQKDEAARIAWNAPGVWSVENDLVVEYEYSFVD